MTAVHVVVPGGIRDPARPSGGYEYDRRVCRGLAVTGWHVVEHVAPGAWPRPDPAEEHALAQMIAGIGDGAVVMIDGLIASSVPGVLVPEANRLRLVVLMHMPLGEGPPGHRLVEAQTREGAVLSAVRQVVTTSCWTRERLLLRYALPPDRVHVAEPGVDSAHLVSGTDRGGELLCVAAVAEHKGHDQLLAALATIADLPWRCVCVGTLHREPAFVERLRQQAEAAGISERVCFPGPRIGDELASAYAAADVLVLASRAETYGMVVTEALARGLPVIATAVGGLPEALGRTSDGRRPGLLVSPGDPDAFAAALRSWLTDAELRMTLVQVTRFWLSFRAR